MNCLFIGRFQPFHLGHLKIIEHVYQDQYLMLIGIGSSQYSHKQNNPFSYNERKEMIIRSLTDHNINRFKIYPIPDIHNPPYWVDHVKNIISDFDVVITNNNVTKQLFERQGYPVKETPSFQRNELSGRHIRECIINYDPWSHLVPTAVYEYIKEIDGEKRLQQLTFKH